MIGHTKLPGSPELPGRVTHNIGTISLVVVLFSLWLALGAQAATHRTGALVRAVQPTHLLIPSLGIDAPIEAMGQDENGVMQAPADEQEVAWYNLGPRPGERGNAVIAGHLDDVHGDPAVFWRVDELEAGDEIVVRFGNGNEKHFTVLSVESYEADAAPMDRIFGLDFEHDLNLVTCDGKWNAQSKLYSKRLVVYTRLIHESTDTAQTNTPSPFPLAPTARPTHPR